MFHYTKKAGKACRWVAAVKKGGKSMFESETSESLHRHGNCADLTNEQDWECSITFKNGGKTLYMGNTGEKGRKTKVSLNGKKEKKTMWTLTREFK